jgi:hypothetical protein
MSYEIVKSITITKDNKIFICSTSNNVQPKDYEKWEYKQNIYSLGLDLDSGNLQPLLSCNKGKWRYFKQEIQNYLLDYVTEYEKNNASLSYLEFQEKIINDKEYKIFIDLLIKTKYTPKKYLLTYNSDNLIYVNLKRGQFRYNVDGAGKIFNFFEKEVIKSEFKRWNLREVEIN